MFTNPVFSGGTTIATNTTGEIRIGNSGSADNHLVIYNSLDQSAMLVFRDMAGAAINDRWSIGYKYGSNDTLRINPSKTVDSADVLQLTDAGALSVDSTVTSSNGVCSGTGALDTGSSNITTTGTISGGTINGSAVWVDYPFSTLFQTAARGYYHRDNDDADDFRKWDDYDTDMVMNYRRIYGHYIVPEDCTLTHMRGIITNQGGTVNPILNVWYCLQTNIATDTGDTTFSKAGSDETVSIGTARIGYQFNEDYDVDLTAGSIIIPTIKHASISSQNYTGSLTLKFITR